MSLLHTIPESTQSWSGEAVAPTSTELLAAMAAGDEAAWAAAVTRFRSLLLGVARRYGLTTDEAADVEQETWVRLLEHVNDIRNAECIAGWLATTATRQSLAVLRRRSREAPAPDAVVDSPQTWDVDERLDAERLTASLWNAVATLSPRERRLMEAMLSPEPLSYAQISEQLSMPIGSIGPVRLRALRRLRAALSHGAPRAAAFDVAVA